MDWICSLRISVRLPGFEKLNVIKIGIQAVCYIYLYIGLSMSTSTENTF